MPLNHPFFERDFVGHWGGPGDRGLSVGGYSSFSAATPILELERNTQGRVQVRICAWISID